jgi:Carboxypeptidase regulatory-like domain
MRMFRFRSAALAVCMACALISATTLVQLPAHGQAISMTGGSIQGTVTDPNGAVLQGAKITIASDETGFSKTLTSDSAGVYSLGPLNPGRYSISVDVSGFQHMVVKTTVSLGTVSSGDVKLQVGSAGVTVEVSSADIQVNTEQVGVAGVVTSEQIDTLPINGRNILDIAQIQPGVILQSGQDFDPTKTGYSALGVNGQNGRSTRILIDGQDISDETVGTVIFNVPEGAIGEFQLNRSNQDVSGEVTSTGQVLMSTKSGANRFHGNAFGIFQDARAGFAGINGADGSDSPFQRNQFGGYLGGRILKDKLFFFGGAERNKQFDSSPVGRSNPNFGALYDAYPNVPDPFKDTFSVGRLDFNGPWGIHYFARATYSNNASFGTAGQAPYALFENQDNIPALVGGADFTTGNFTHSVRFGYLKFINNLFAGANALGNGIYNPSTDLNNLQFELIGAIYAGAGNEDAPQKTYQSSKQFRYDGTWTKGAHNIKYGGEITRILGGGFAAFYSTFLADISTNKVHLLAKCDPDASSPLGGVNANGQCPGDPLYGYMPAEFVFGNGNGSFSERPAFGLPGGGQFSWRLASYVGDTWRVAPYLTLVAGVRWSVDTDRANQDLPTVTCGQVDAELQFPGCDSAHASTPLFDFFGPGWGLGKKTHQPWANFGPQLGFVFSPGSRKLAFRGGIGYFYENNLFNNGSNARAQNSPAEFPGFAYGLNNFTQSTLSLPGYQIGIQGVMTDGTTCVPGEGNPGCISFPQLYSMSMAKAIPIMAALDSKYKTASAVPQANSSFIGFANGDALQALSAYAGPYLTPYSMQVNGGAQYELKSGLVLSVDYLHNATFKVPLTVDTNHVGAARYLNKVAAQNAINAVLDEYEVNSIDDAIAAGASIGDFAGAGLDSGNAYLSGYAASAFGLSPNTGAAFGGANANLGAGNFILPVGKSAYDALQVVVQQQKSHPMRGILDSNAQISYNFSRVETNSSGGSNQFFGGYGAYNNDCVNCFIGRNGQDHTNMLSMAGTMTVKYGPQISLVGHFFSAPPSTLTLADVTGAGTGSDSGAIFVTDLDGDGSAGDLLPGTNPGDYMHSVKGGGLARVVDNYNKTQAGTLTPAGKALVASGLFTERQLVALGATKAALAPPPQNPMLNPATRTLDLSLRYPIRALNRFREGLVLTPAFTMYNVVNMANYGPIGGLADANTDTTSNVYLNSANTKENLWTGRTLRGSGNGTFDQGGPRTMEFGLKLDF